MRSRVVSFRVPDDLYEEFERKCKDEGASPAIRLREFVESECHPIKVEDTDAWGDSEDQIEADKVNTDDTNTVFPDLSIGLNRDEILGVRNVVMTIDM